MLDAARGAAVVFATSLPDYIVKRTITRYAGQRSTAHFSGEGGTWGCPLWIVGNCSTASRPTWQPNMDGKSTRTSRNQRAGQRKPCLPEPRPTGEFSGTLLPDSIAGERHCFFPTSAPIPSGTIRHSVSDYRIDQPSISLAHHRRTLPAWPGTFRNTPAYSGEIWTRQPHRTGVEN